MTDNIYNPKYVKDLFDKMSGSYERVNYITSFSFSLRWRKQFLKHIVPSDNKLEVIDLMTGMGEVWGPMRDKFPNANLSALDFSEGMIKNADSKNEKHYNGSVTVLHQNLLNNQLPANHYDIVLCAFGLKTFDAEQLAVLANEVKRILKPGGQFSMIEVSEPENAILRFLYRLHLSKVVPIAGKIMLGNPTEYRMLWKYTSAFKNALAATAIFKKAGLDARYVKYFNGCATGIAGTKA